MEVSRLRPFGRIATRLIYPLAYEDVQPVIRICHKLVGRLAIPQRIIFDHELVWIMRGQARLILAGKRTQLSPGVLLFIPPFVPHAFECDESETVEHMAVHFDLAPGVPPWSDKPQQRTAYEVRLSERMQIPTVTAIRLGDEIAAELTGVLRGWDSRRPPGLLSAKAHLLRVLVLLMKLGRDEVEGFTTATGLSAGEMRDRRRVERAIKHMEDHFSQPVEAADLARMTGLSLSHFTRLFRECTGHAPMQYLRRFRVQHARRLLGDDSLSIKEVAARCGFEDPYHFSKVFHALDGLPPTLYREALLAGRK